MKQVRDGAELVVLTDRTVYDGERRYLDPHLATSAIDQALKHFRVEPGEENLRRRCSIVLRSAAIRNVHDVVLALGLGANGVCPYVMLEVVCVDDYAQDVSNVCAALSKGIEKVISTIGIHEVRGYARQFSSIGLQARARRDLPDRGVRGSADGGIGFAALDADTDERLAVLRSAEEGERPAKTFRFYPKVYKAAIAAANGTACTRTTRRRFASSRRSSPISMRHIIDSGPIDKRSNRVRWTAGRSSRVPHRDLIDELRVAVGARF